MTVQILDAGVRASVLAAADQESQLEAISASFPGNAQVRYFGAGDVLRTTCIHQPLQLTLTSPRRLDLGALVSETIGTPGPATYAIVGVPGGAGILQCSVSLAASVSASSRTNLGAGSGADGLRIVGSSSLPVEVFPFTLPTAGNARLIASANAHLAVNPGQLSNSDFTYSVFGSFGSGDFNPHWSPRGAYMHAGTGGHNHPETFGCVYYDFQAWAWGYIAAVGQADRGPVNQDTETNGSPWWEMTGTQIPAPPHPYSMQAVLHPSLAGASRGALAYITRGAVGIGAVGAPVAHRFSLPGGVWSRLSVGATDIEGQPAYDEVLGRYYVIPNQVWSYNRLRYLRTSDWTWQLSDLTGFSYATGNGGAGSNVLRYGRLIVVHQGTSGGSSVGRFQAIDLDNLTAGWTVLTVTGAVTDVLYENAWTYHAAQNVFYRRYTDLSGLTDYPQGQVIYKLTPPASSPLTNSWSITSVTLGGDAIPENRHPHAGTQAHKRLMYLPALQMLGWVTPNGVSLLNPT